MHHTHVVIQQFSWRWYRDTAQRCKLYDYDRLCWTDFKGRATSKNVLAAGMTGAMPTPI